MLANLFNPFPKLSTNYIGVPTSTILASRIDENITFLHDLVKLRRLPEGASRPGWMNFKTYKVFPQLINEFSFEFCDNYEKGLVLEYWKKYNRIYNNLIDCITSFEENKDLFEFDMSFMPDYRYHNTNWYKLVYDDLQTILFLFEDRFKPILKSIIKDDNNIISTDGAIKNGIDIILKEIYPNITVVKLNELLNEITKPEHFNPLKIAYLEHLGILKKIRDNITKDEYGCSSNRLAKAVYPIINSKPTTVQPIISALDSGNKTSSQYPCTEKNIRIITKFIQRLDI